MHSSFSLVRQSSITSEKENESFDCINLFFSINLINKNKKIIISLKFYCSCLSKNIFITPQAIILLYDITSKESFESVIKYYIELKKDKNYMNIKYILVGNKIDLFDEENDEKKENKEKKKKNINNEIDFIYYKQIIDKENFDLIKNISGLNGFYLEDLLKETAIIFYNLVKLMENASNELYQIEGDSVIIENKLEYDKRQTSYHDIDYKNEVNKINKSNNKNCCLICNIF